MKILVTHHGKFHADEVFSTELTVDYDKSDESEIVIKILMFGPNMKVLEPKDVSYEVNQRIKKQKELGL